MSPFARAQRAFRAHLAARRELTETQRSLLSEVAALRAALLGSAVPTRSALEQMARDVSLLRLLAESGEMQSLLGAGGRYADPRSLSRFVARVHSQVGEDGILAEIFRRIGPSDRRFIEIGVGDGRENTTRFLLDIGWSGVWIEGSPENAAAAASLMREHVKAGRLVVRQAFVTAENVDEVLDAAGAPAEADYLSLDIDQNTSHVWRALRRKFRVTCVEYNSGVPPTAAIEVPYDPRGVWDGSGWFGASLKAMEIIGRGKGMALVGCDPMGVNGFFVAAAEADERRFLAPFDAETHFEPPRYSALGAAAQHLPDGVRAWQEAR